MTDVMPAMTTEEKRALLRERLASGRQLPKTYPASYSQRRLWFMHKLAPDSPAYNVEAALPLTAMDAKLLERAINGVVARHGALRTTFVEVDGEPVQRVAPDLHVPLEQHDLSRLPLRRREADVIALRQACATDPFDLTQGPLIRTKLIRLGPQKHLLLLNLHHILADGWSMGIFSTELTTLYEAFAAGQPSPLPPLSLQYGDFAAWQRGEGDGDGMATELGYWTDKLTGLTPLEVPTDHPRPPVQSYVGAFYNHTFSADLTRRLEAFSRQQGVTLFMTLLTGFKVLLARIAQTEDVAVGTYIANRDRTEIEGLIGFFLNTLVLRSAIPADARFSDALATVRETALGAYANQAVPFERLVEVLQPPRDLGRNPLVQIVFQLQNATEDSAEGATALIDYQRSAAAFDLTATAYVQKGQLHFTYEYATDLFSEPTIARLSQRFANVLDQAIREPATSIDDLDILLADEHPQSDADLALDAAPWNGDSVTAAFARAVEAEPDAPAFFIGEACATLGQVATCADRIATALAQAGVKKGDAVGVALPRSVELAASLMAIWKTGGVYVPLDPAYPADRLRFMAEDSGMRLVITGHVGSEMLEDGLQNVNANAAIGDLSVPADPFDAVPLGPYDPSHIIYTSGSTGQPKGAVSPHLQLLNRLHWMWDRFPHDADEVEVVKTATSFIDSIWELTGPLIARRPASIVDSEALLDPVALVAQLARDGVSRMWVTPSYLRLLLDSIPDIGTTLPQLRRLFVTGEKLPADLVRHCAETLPQTTLHNLYGTSEAWDICCDMTGATEDTPDPVPVGQPLDYVTVAVLDTNGRPVPFGVPGEAYIGGAAPCLGFANRADQDQTRFCTIKTATGPLRLLSSGDRACARADGAIEILGRMDDQLKINGMRVHPAEVEAALNSIPGVTAAAVAGVPGPDKALRLWAWVIGDKGEDTVRTAVAQTLPAHMVPDRILLTDALPQTPSGKVDRAALLAEAANAPAAIPMANERPVTDLERQIADIFAQVLGREVAVEQNFFAAGGHSLLAARALARINDQLALDLGIRDFFLAPSATGLAARAEAAPDTPRRTKIKRLPRAARPA